MKDKSYESFEPCRIIKNSELSDWRCYLFGGFNGNNNLIWTPGKGEEPNWFWRLMQYLILGNKWVKVKGEK